MTFSISLLPVFNAGVEGFTLEKSVKLFKHDQNQGYVFGGKERLRYKTVKIIH